MKKIVHDNDLGIPYTNRFNKLLINSAKSLLGINKINLLYDKLYEYSGVDFPEQALKELNISYKLDEHDLINIPKEGAFIVIANHPHGALDGLLLADVVIKKRPDAKFLGNFLLEKIEPMKDMVLSVNPFNSKASRNIPAIRQAMNHLSEGKGLIIFPAGEVSTYYDGLKKCEDKIWEDSIIKFIKSANVPIVPLFISGKNSKKFHAFGKIHPIFRTVRLPLELLNKTDYQTEIHIGSPIAATLQRENKTIPQLRDFLRANVYFLENSSSPSESIEYDSTVMIKIDPPADIELISGEISKIRTKCLLHESSHFQVFCCDSQDIPITLKEICRLREITFRAIGEGTNQSIDIDSYDSYYKHLFVWDSKQNAIVGAYRIGLGGQIIDNQGIDGLYTYTLFEYNTKLTPILKQSIELGRSFVVSEYQKMNKPLLLLWQGILSILLTNQEYKYLIGPVSISDSFSEMSKNIIYSYIKYHHWNSQLSKYVMPRNGIKNLHSHKFDMKLLSNVNDIRLIDKLIYDIDNGTSIPILIKKYLQIGGSVLAFNIDPAFNNCLDALLLLDVEKVPMTMTKLLNKEGAFNIENTRFSK